MTRDDLSKIGITKALEAVSMALAAEENRTRSKLRALGIGFDLPDLTPDDVINATGDILSKLPPYEWEKNND